MVWIGPNHLNCNRRKPSRTSLERVESLFRDVAMGLSEKLKLEEDSEGATRVLIADR